MQRNDGTKEISLRTVLEAAKRRKYYILAPALVLAVGFAVYAFQMPERYRAEALLTAEPMATAHDFVDAAGASHATHVMNVDEQLRKVKEIALSSPVLERVIKEYKLYDQVGGKVTDAAMQDMKSRINIRLEGGDEVRHSQPQFVSFYIGFDGSESHQVRDVANRLAELFIEHASSARERRVEEVAGFIEAELEPLKKRLTEQSESIRGYKQGAAHALPEQATTNLRLLESLQEQYQSKVESTANEEARRVAILEEIKELDKQGIAETREPKEKSQAEERLEDLRLKVKEAQTRYTQDHPEIARLGREIRDLEKIVAAQGKKPRGEPSPFYMHYLQLKGELEAVERRVQSYREEQRRIASQMSVYRSRVESAPIHESALSELTRDYAATQTQYQHMLEKKHEAKLAERFERMSKDVVFRIVESARLPLGPYSPHRERIILLGLFAGLGLGIVVSFLAEQMDNSFESVEEFQKFSKLPVLAAIPSIPLKAQFKRNSQKGRIVTLNDPKSIAAEQFQILAMKMENPLKDSCKVLAVVSSAGGEGKTMTAINLSIALAGAVDGRVLLVDSDLRRPRVHEYLDLGSISDRGFGDLLSKPEDDIGRYIRQVKNLCVIPGNAQCANPVGLLASQKARGLFARLREQFAFVVVDCPPILPIADSLVLAGLADEVLLILRARQTPREVFQRAVESLNTSSVLGVVLNDVDYQYSRYAYAYRYYQKNYLAQH